MCGSGCGPNANFVFRSAFVMNVKKQEMKWKEKQIKRIELRLEIIK